MPVPHLLVPVTPPVVVPPQPPASRFAPTMTLERDGVVISLTPDQGYVVMPGVEGIDEVPWLLAESSPYSWDGGYIADDPRADFRNGLIPLHLFDAGHDPAAFRALKRDLMRLLSPRGKRNPITWKVTYQDGYWRSIDGWYVPDGQDAQDADKAGTTWQNIDVPLRLPDPFWRGPDVDIEFVVPTVAATPLISATVPMLPWYVAASSLIGEAVTITNPGDVEAFPVWTVTGPGTDVTVTLEDTGQSFMLAGLVAAGEVITVDARRGRLTVTDATGANQFSRLGANPDLFPLPAGDSSLTIAMTGAGPGAGVDLTFSPRYLTGA